MKYENSSNKLEYANNQTQNWNIKCKLKYKQKWSEIKGDILSVYSDLISQIPTSDYVHLVTNKYFILTMYKSTRETFFLKFESV